MIPDHIFREYDIRGVADTDLTSPLVKHVGRGLAELLAPEGDSTNERRLVVCRDCRLSSDRMKQALVEGLMAGGATVVDIGIGPTPLMYFAVHELDADGGIMITGSHNPKQDNGLKIMKGKGSFFGAQIQELKAWLHENEPETSGTSSGRLLSESVPPRYLAMLRERIRVESTDLDLVIDAGNGAAGPLGLQAFREFGLAPEALFCDMDGTFPNHHPDPTVPENLTRLISTVKDRGAIAGLAWDGDGDRLGVVDQSGEMIWGDRLLALFARHVLKEAPGAKILADVKCSSTLFADIEKHGGTPIMWKTGHSLIKSKMKREDALLAGEMSGHFFFAHRYFGYDDGIYAALRLTEILAREKKTIVELLSDLPTMYSTPEIRMSCPDAIKSAVVERVKSELASSDSGELIDLDGVRINYADGSWGLLRASNTGPVLVLRFEAPTEARRDELEAHFKSLVERQLTDLS